MTCQKCDYTGDDFYTTTAQREEDLHNEQGDFVETIIELINIYVCPSCECVFVGKKK